MDTDNTTPQNTNENNFAQNNGSLPEPTLNTPSQNFSNQPQTTPQVFTEPLQNNVSQQQPPQPVQKKKPMLLFVLLGLFLLLSGSAAAYFGLIVPNKPENIWKSALENTSEAYDEMVEYLDQEREAKGFKAKGTLKLSGAINGDGNIEAEGDDKTVKMKIDAGFYGSRYHGEALFNTPEGSTTPDMYIKVSGIQGLGVLLDPAQGDLSTRVNGLDNQWIFVDHTLIDQMFARAGGGSEPQITREDAAEIARKLGEVNEEYLFTTNESKRVFHVVNEIGKEERDGRSVYHFEVGFNKENLKSYIREVKSRLEDTKLKVFLESSGQSYDKAFNIDDMLKEVDDMSGNETADVWVDMKTRLIRVVRFTDKDNEGSYFEIRLPINSDNEIPAVLFFNIVGEEPSTIELGINVNTDTDVVRINFDMNTESSGQKQNAKVDLTIEPSDAKVEFVKPEGARSINELINAFYGNSQGLPGGGL